MRLRRRTLIASSFLAGALALSGCAADAPASTESDPASEVSLTFAFWGNDDRATRYNELITAFNEKHPNITIKTTFTDFPNYWEKRATEVAGGGLPDVFQFSDSYLRQYAEPGHLLDLAEMSEHIDFSSFEDSLLGTGRLNDVQYSLPTGYSMWANFVNDDLLAEHGVAAPEGDTSFEDFDQWMADFTDISGGEVYGGTDYTQRIQTFELVLRANGKNLYTEDGQLGFTEDELRDYWESGAGLRDGVTAPQQRLEELSPISGFGARLTATEMSWSNFLGSYLADSGAESMSIVAPPTAVPGSKDLYRQGGLQMAISETSEHPEEAALFLDFVVNSPEAGEIFGTTLGFPASSTKLAGTTLEGVDKQVADYIESVSDRVGEAPPVPVVGYGSLEQTFWDLGKSIGLGAITVDQAVTDFFIEAEVILG
ncbi:carbohydrate ABC transporter substrate-binding protein [Tessaracoccus rhinocerotis]|uniref:Carbohydrate ABC transporter substrate-binding protein n=1 Tax=Tessaracoccus rhinocerotis TaxID=1689449 RepID=A0A553JZ12_9ACTN|nr:ABC transporter substrate-binding protein [Tessaracoccus rhinocerotis]TRY17690.1 carbohydrate ABC transporter substrate-binding protein [Tessaracoccus rhinocerotis]